jgi:hypothetical protein
VQRAPVDARGASHDDERVGFVVTPEDRDWFDRCRRAWDFGARVRRNLERSVTRVPALDRIVRNALAVYYFPGMWTWSRSIVEPLVERSLHDAGFPYPAFDFVQAYARFAETVDHFTPLRVETEVDAHVLHPERSGAELAAPDGGAVLYRDRIHLFVVAETSGDDAYWLVVHRMLDDQQGWASPDQLALDERALLACWAWEHVFLVSVAGVQYNEVRVSPPEFRRERIAYTDAEKSGAARRLAIRAAQMIAAPPLGLDPTPQWEHCARCEFRAPCVALNRGEDATALLAERYRPRPPDELEPGRLGGQSWGMGRGAAPPRFGD